MSNNEPGTSNGSDVTELREFLYLDRARLISYIAQIFDGLTSSRQLSESVIAGEVETTDQVESGQTITAISSGKLGIPLIAGVDLQAQVEKAVKKTTGGDYLIRMKHSIEGQTKFDQDNLFLLFEKYINENNLVSDFEIGQHQDRLVYANGHLQVEDRKFLVDFLSKLDVLIKSGIIGKQEISEFNTMKSQMTGITTGIRALNLDTLTCFVLADTYTVGAMLNPEWLTLPRDQFQILYGEHRVKITMLGIPVESKVPKRKLGALSTLDFSGVTKILNAGSDYQIFPIAIYRTFSNS